MGPRSLKYSWPEVLGHQFLFIGWFIKNHHLFYSKGLSSSKTNHHFLRENDFQRMIYVDIFLVFLGLLS